MSVKKKDLKRGQRVLVKNEGRGNYHLHNSSFEWGKVVSIAKDKPVKVRYEVDGVEATVSVTQIHVGKDADGWWAKQEAARKSAEMKKAAKDFAELIVGPKFGGNSSAMDRLTKDSSGYRGGYIQDRFGPPVFVGASQVGTAVVDLKELAKVASEADELAAVRERAVVIGQMMALIREQIGEKRFESAMKMAEEMSGRRL